MNKIFIEGRLGRNAEVKETSNGNKFVRFTVAVNWRKSKEKEDRTTWYDVTSFNPSYTGNIVQYLVSGTPVIVVGDLEPEMNSGKDGKMYLNMSVRANSIEFPRISYKKDENSNNAINNTAQQPKEANKPKTVARNNDNEIPDDEIGVGVIPPSVSNININDNDDDLPF